MKAILSVLSPVVKIFQSPTFFVLHPLNSRYQDMEVKKGEFQIIGRVAEKKKKRY